MAALRIIGDVHAQIRDEDLMSGNRRPYLDLIAGVDRSVQIGDMGDAETYRLLVDLVDADKHRFFPGNHDRYPDLPPHSLGDFGATCWGGVNFFFVRGAASSDRDKLVRMGHELGITLWFAEEELTVEQMRAAEEAYLLARPTVMLTHDAPTEIARFAWEHARRQRRPNPGAPTFAPSRTNEFLTRLLKRHAPRLWLFGHHHYDWRHREADTFFVCVGELSYVDIDETGVLS
jgi:Calcineurin-like phosphoesterase